MFFLFLKTLYHHSPVVSPVDNNKRFQHQVYIYTYMIQTNDEAQAYKRSALLKVWQFNILYPLLTVLPSSNSSIEYFIQIVAFLQYFVVVVVLFLLLLVCLVEKMMTGVLS